MKVYLFLIIITASLHMYTYPQKSNVEINVIKGHEVETGYFPNGQPYAKIGNKSPILINIEALSFEHVPPRGIMLKQFVKSSEPFLDRYTVYLIGRKPNLPDDYLFDKMAEDYLYLLRNVFKNPVDIMGVSTGGQLLHYVAAGNEDLVNKAVIISAAYKLSDAGVIIEREAAEYFALEKYGKSMAKLMELIHPPGLKRVFMKSLAFIFGGLAIKDIEYPNDFQVEVKADRSMNFEDRLHEIKVPTLIISGGKDICYAAEDVKKTAEGIKDADLIMYEKYGHNVAVVHYKKIVHEIKNFLYPNQ